jgi:hypothetical protein
MEACFIHYQKHLIILFEQPSLCKETLLIQANVLRPFYLLRRIHIKIILSQLRLSSLAEKVPVWAFRMSGVCANDIHDLPSFDPQRPSSGDIHRPLTHSTTFFPYRPPEEVDTDRQCVLLVSVIGKMFKSYDVSIECFLSKKNMNFKRISLFKYT